MQQINLYQEQFRVRREPARTRVLALGLVVLLAMLFAVSGWMQYESWRVTDRLERARERRDRVEQEMLALRAELERMAAGEQARAGLPAELRAELAAKRRLMDYLAEGPLASRDGFSGHLQALARRVVEDLWFDRIQLERGGDRIRFEGHALEAALVPRMIAALGEEAVYRGHSFRSLLIERPEQAAWRVDFLLASEAVEREEPAGRGTSR